MRSSVGKSGVFRLLIFFAVSTFLFFSPPHAKADETIQFQSFTSDITINKDTSITVTEKLDINYTAPHHGIFRNIPEKRLRVLSVTDEVGNKYKYKVTGSSIKSIKIGDPDKEVVGRHVYVITYEVKGMIKEFPEHYELYWNVTGSDWDEKIPVPKSKVESDFADITKIKCFAGYIGSSTEDCTGSFTKNRADFESLVSTGLGSDFTIVLALNKNNQFVFPSSTQKTADFLKENWFYFLTALPFLIPFYYWLKKGRDQRYLSENIYYTPDNKALRTVGIFERKHIPLVYSPIKGLSPSEVGTLIDEKVDIQDVVAEITELARLGYLKIKKLPKKGLFGKVDYEFSKTFKDSSKLAHYQKIILDGLFEDGPQTLLSDQKNKFYVHLKKFRSALYQNMNSKKYFDGNPEKIRSVWIAGVVAISLVVFFIINTILAISENDFLPLLFIGFFAIPGYFFAKAMPRRTPLGYALYQQTRGLSWYLKKGVWRHEIAEKNLFIEEILPLAISLGVIKQLAKDMTILKIEPPSYISGTTMNSFTSDMGNFQSNIGSALASSPGGSGGSGFSGGSSGGGGGGGGGGGW